MANLKQDIINLKPRENSGSSSSNRFDFQKNWAICKILELHEKPEDYLLTLEHHDDIVIFDSSTNPQKISFYQVKTSKSQHWTLNSLTKRKVGKNSLLNSHLGKLYEHIEKFGDSVESLNFVTNNKIKGKLLNDTKCEDTNGFCCRDLNCTDLNKIIDSLKNEHSLNSLKNFQSLTFFKLGELSIDEHSAITKARLVDYIDKNLPDIKYQIAPLYKSIFDEIRKKSNVEKVILDFEELKKQKSISRSEFDSYLNLLRNDNDLKDQTLSIEHRLNSEGADLALVKNFKRYSKIYEVKKMTYNDKPLRSIEKTVINQIKLMNIDYTAGLISCSETVLDSLQIENLINNTIDKELIRTIIFYKLYE